MKKIILGIVAALVVIVVVAIVAVFMLLDKGVKKAIETAGPMITKTTMTVEGVNLSPLSGAGSIKGLLVGNPEGFKTPQAIKVGNASMALDPGSLFADKVVVRSIKVEGPEIMYETNLKTSNLGKILENVEQFTGPDTKEDEASKKLQVDEFVISGGKIHVSVTALGGQPITVPLPEVRLTGLGKGPEGITAAELTKLALDKVVKAAMEAGEPALKDLSRQATERLTQEANKAAAGAVDKASKSLNDLFKKK
jgi:uncharacterized protein involved in outer membrane biogenesis